MMDTMNETVAIDTTPLMVKMVFDSWNALLKDFNNALESVTDEQLAKPIAPNKNRGIYVLGHMVAVHDDMLPLLGFGEKMYPKVNAIFKSSDKEATDIPSAAELRTYWKNVNDRLAASMSSMQPEEWMHRHNSVSAEDFATQPHRNKLNVMITRTCHLSYHLGQMKWVQ
jgi:hypothetical protein